MAVVTTKSGPITDRDSTPSVLADSGIAKGRLMVATGTVAVGNGDSIASKLIFASVPSNAFVKEVLLSCDGGGTVGAADIGVYQTTANGSAVVAADFFASAQSIVSALKNSDVTHESGVYGIEDVEKPLWEALGLSADSQRDYDIVATLTAATDAASDVSLHVVYAV